MLPMLTKLCHLYSSISPSTCSLWLPSRGHLINTSRFRGKPPNGCLLAALRSSPPPSPVSLSVRFRCRWQILMSLYSLPLGSHIHVFTLISQHIVPRGYLCHMPAFHRGPPCWWKEEGGEDICFGVSWVFRKETIITISWGSQYLSSPKSSRNPVTLLLGPPWSSSDLLLLSGCNSGGLQPPWQGPMGCHDFVALSSTVEAPVPLYLRHNPYPSIEPYLPPPCPHLYPSPTP